MEIEFDPEKNARNLRERGLSFERAAEFDFETALHLLDTRRDYGEVRRIAVGYLDRRLHVLGYVLSARGIRVFSLRRANTREAKRYGKAKTLD